MARIGSWLKWSGKPTNKKGKRESLEEAVSSSGDISNTGEIENNTVLTTSSGHQLGDLVDMDFFPREKFSESQLDMIRYFDAANKEINKGLSRRMGGPYDEHIKDVLVAYLGIIESLKLDPDYKVVASLIMHDSLENHINIRSRITKIRSLYEKIQKKGDNVEKLQNKVDSIKSEVIQQRLRIIGQMYNDFKGFAEGYCKTHNLDDKHIRDMVLGGTEILGVVEWLTRHTEQRFFHGSIHFLYTMNKAKDYRNSLDDSPLQFKIMEERGATNGMEPSDYFFLRALAKPMDRIALTRERRQRFTDEQATELGTLMGKHELLQRTYGKTDFEGSEMPRPYSLNLLFRNSIVFSNMHSAFVNYGGEVVHQKESNPLSFSYLKVALKARENLIEESKAVYVETRESYEKDLPKEVVEEVKAKVAKLPSSHFGTLTGEGSISRGIGLDTNPPQNWEDLDRDHEGNKSIIAMARNYEDVLGFGRLLEYFSDKRKNKADLRHGNFRFHCIKGLTDVPFLDVTPYETR